MAAAGTAADDADYAKFVTTGQATRANTLAAAIAAG